MLKLTALQEMAACDTLLDEFEEIMWSYGQGVGNEEINKVFKQALRNFRQAEKEAEAWVRLFS